MKFGVIEFHGSNCHEDMVQVLAQFMQAVAHVIRPENSSLDRFNSGDCIVLTGEISPGADQLAGAISRIAAIMPALQEFAAAGGYVWGIGQGFQVLCEAGLLPGSLLRNEQQEFIDRVVHVKATNGGCALNAGIPAGRILSIPDAHANVRYHADPVTLKELLVNGQIMFQYCDAKGQVSPESNPNGSPLNIAGICNARKNVFGMMPHPERAAGGDLGNVDGRLIFESLLQSATVSA